ncbi:putative UPF0711 protein C18orf21 -like [Scophthalmus maximus]|uniref:Putative UPF0711 protein C18orf21-like n=1 Tax=Scophthalmus maximus TaxID=52904 RepID=A0A2U9D1E5_SCOMX|nr:putative UPF0711 protein C18orf21 -like [Scophthalmus maximus]
MQRWVGQLPDSACIKLDAWARVVNTSPTRHTEKEEFIPPGPSKPNSPTLCSRHLSESEMATFVSMATCHTCNNTSRHKGMNRDFISTLAKTHSTPGSTGKHRTPQSTSRSNMTTPKTPGKDKTPGHTPRSSTSSNTSGSGSSSSKPPSKPKNWVVQRLSKILMREDNQGSKKGGLKDFLSSL